MTRKNDRSMMCIVVEDNAMERLIIESALKSAGFPVTSCGTAEEALLLLEHRINQFTLIILDLLLYSDFEQAYQLITEARKLSPLVEIIILSAHGSAAHAVRAVKLGASDFIDKPRSLEYTEADIAEILLPKIREVLSHDRRNALVHRRISLRGFGEDQLIDYLLIPLLKEMGYLGVRRTGSHGPGESGRDLLPFYKYGDFGERVYYAAQVKVGAITARSGSKANVQRICDQVNSVLRTSFVDVVNGLRRKVDRCILFCTGQITNDARRLLEDAFEGRRDFILIEADDLLNLLQRSQMFPYFDSLARKTSVMGLSTNLGVKVLVMDLASTKKNEALREILWHLAESQMVEPGDVDSILDSLLQREELGGTGRKGVALPHTQHPCVARPVVVLARSKAGIEWGASDGLLAHLVILYLFPMHSLRSVEKMLYRISHLLADDQFRLQLPNIDLNQLLAVISDAESRE